MTIMKKKRNKRFYVCLWAIYTTTDSPITVCQRPTETQAVQHVADNVGS